MPYPSASHAGSGPPSRRFTVECNGLEYLVDIEPAGAAVWVTITRFDGTQYYRQLKHRSATFTRVLRAARYQAADNPGRLKQLDGCRDTAWLANELV